MKIRHLVLGSLLGGVAGLLSGGNHLLARPLEFSPYGEGQGPCVATNASGQNSANGPTITTAGGITTYTDVTPLSWDCTAGPAPACGVCADTRWYTGPTINGPWTPSSIIYAKSGGGSLCGSAGNTANCTDTKSVTSDGTFYKAVYGIAPMNADGTCPDGTLPNTYTGYGGYTFKS